MVVITASPSLNLTDRFTVEAWIRPSGWGENPGTGFGRIMDKNAIRLLTLKSNPFLGDNTVCLWLLTQGGTSLSAIPESSIVLDTWQHIAASYDGNTGEVKMYLNGCEQSLTQTSPPSGILNDNLEIDLIAGNSISQNDTFDGVIDELRVWNSVRTGGEIQSFMNQYLNGDEPGLAGYWRMNEGNGQFINDLTVYGNDGVLVSTQWVAGAPMGQTNAHEPSGIGRDYDLSAVVYPNPFNALISISYNLPYESLVEIDIYNLLGQRIANIAKGVKPAGHNVSNWRPRGHPSGIYYYKINFSDGAATGKILLLK
jgi:hypothetical protein